MKKIKIRGSYTEHDLFESTERNFTIGLYVKEIYYRTRRGKHHPDLRVSLEVAAEPESKFEGVEIVGIIPKAFFADTMREIQEVQLWAKSKEAEKKISEERKLVRRLNSGKLSEDQIELTGKPKTIILSKPSKRAAR